MPRLLDTIRHLQVSKQCPVQLNPNLKQRFIKTPFQLSITFDSRIEHNLPKTTKRKPNPPTRTTQNEPTTTRREIRHSINQIHTCKSLDSKPIRSFDRNRFRNRNFRFLVYSDRYCRGLCLA